jgi:NADPH:quinone reductase-like Zn-dependent oxidoreductase
MNVLEIVDDFGIDNLQVTERPDPTPGPGEIVVEMSAISLNYRDLMTVDGRYNPRQPIPLIPCSDGVGTVVEVGQGVSRFAVGDRVCPIFAQTWIDGEPTHDRIRSSLGGPLDGTLAQYVCLNEDGWVHAPPNLADTAAATLTCAAVTAWSALVTQGGVTAGDTVLVQGTGGVSMFALQFAKVLGARVICTSSSDDKLERARELGADDTINYRDEPRWGRVARDLTGGIGVDHVVEVGGAGTLQQSLKAVKAGGHVSVIGVLSGASEPLNIVPVLMQNIRLQGVFVGHRQSFEAMNRAIELHDIQPVVHETYDARKAADAFRALESASHIGKIVLEWDD